MGWPCIDHPDFLYGPGNTYISGNTIGTRMSGANMMPRPNQSYGIVHQAASHLYIGIDPDNPLMLNPNIIAQNNNYGVFINRYTDSEAGESNVSLRGNVNGFQ
jgi:exopolysaccharide biosynthesis predicted pyruvyltransferase EpsI